MSTRREPTKGIENPSAAKDGITVVIPTFNREELLKRAIVSALNQTVKPEQVIVVDDGSTDGTPEMCGKFAHSIEYVRQANAGAAEARNHGIRLARHEWIAFLDSDDYWTPTHLERMLAAIKDTFGQASFYFSDVFMDNGTRDATLWSRIGFKVEGSCQLSPDATDWMLSRGVPASIQSTVFNAAVLKASGGFDGRFEVMEDTELFLRLGIGGNVCAVNTVGCFYTADDKTHNRLTTKVNAWTENHGKCSCRLWRLVDSQFPNLDPSRRKIIFNNLAESYWRLSRCYWRSGRVHHSIIPFLRCIKTEPRMLITLFRRRMSTRRQKEVSGPVSQPES